VTAARTLAFAILTVSAASCGPADRTSTSGYAATARVAVDATALRARTPTTTAAARGKPTDSTVVVTTRHARGGTPLFIDNFETGRRATPQNGVRWKGAPPSITVSNRVAHSGAYSMQFRFLGRPDCSDSSAEQRFQLGVERPEVWIEYWLYLPDGTEGLASRWQHRSQSHCTPNSKKDDGMKFMSLWNGGYTDKDNVLTVLGVRRAADATSYLTISAKNGERANFALLRVAEARGFIASPILGKWVRIRLHFKIASRGKTDGIVRVWQNDALLAERTDLPLYTRDITRNGFTEGYVWGWSNSGYSQDTFIYMDDFTIYDANPGW
jgi:hypothetical protein